MFYNCYIIVYGCGVSDCYVIVGLYKVFVVENSYGIGVSC